MEWHWNGPIQGTANNPKTVHIKHLVKNEKLLAILCEVSEDCSYNYPGSKPLNMYTSNDSTAVSQLPLQ